MINASYDETMRLYTYMQTLDWLNRWMRTVVWSLGKVSISIQAFVQTYRYSVKMEMVKSRPLVHSLNRVTFWSLVCRAWFEKSDPWYWGLEKDNGYKSKSLWYCGDGVDRDGISRFSSQEFLSRGMVKLSLNSDKRRVEIDQLVADEMVYPLKSETANGAVLCVSHYKNNVIVCIEKLHRRLFSAAIIRHETRHSWGSLATSHQPPRISWFTGKPQSCVVSRAWHWLVFETRQLFSRRRNYSADIFTLWNKYSAPSWAHEQSPQWWPEPK